MFLGFEFIRDLSFYDLYRGHPRTPSGSNKSKKIRMSPRVATRTHVTKITLKYACRTQNGAVRPERASLHIRPFFNVTTRAARTRSNSHPTAARPFFMMNSLKNPRGSHHAASRTTAATRTLFFNVTTRAASTRSNSHHTAARTFFLMNQLEK